MNTTMIDNGKSTVLCVDDDPGVLHALRRVLSAYGCRVLEASDGNSALDILEREKVNVLVCDQSMPGISGIETLRLARERSPATTRILLTGKCSDEAVVIPAVNEGKVFRLLAKPWNDDDIRRAVAESLGIEPEEWAERGERMRERLQPCSVSIHTTEAVDSENVEELKDTDKHSATNVRSPRPQSSELEGNETTEDILRRTQTQLLQADKLASIGQLAAGVAHEINNPIGFVASNLNSLCEYVESLQALIGSYEVLEAACKDAPELATMLADIRDTRDRNSIEHILLDIGDLIGESIEGVDRVRKIVADLRDFSHVDQPDIVDEDINALLDKTISLAHNELKYKTQVIREYGELPLLPCYGGKLAQVFLNLLVNAAHAIETHGTIAVRTGTTEDRVWIEVADTGHGISTEHLKCIFDPFFTTKRVGEGTGLGLHLARSILRAHGGQIEVQSAVGKGTTFRLGLPIAGPPSQMEDVNAVIN